MYNLLICLLAFLLIKATISFNELLFHRSISTLPNPTGLRMSPNDHTLAIVNQSSVSFYQGFTGQLKGSYQFSTIKDNYISAFDYSKSGLFFGIGYRGNGVGYVSSFMNLSQWNSQLISEQPHIFENNDTFFITGVTFIGDKFYITADLDGTISVQNTSRISQPSFYKFPEYQILALQIISPDENIFAAAAIQSNSSLVILSFQYSPNDKNLSIVNKVPVQMQNLTTINDMELKGTKMYFVGNTRALYFYDIINSSVSELAIPTKFQNGYKAVQVFENESIFVLNNQTHFEYVLYQNQRVIVGEISISSVAFSRFSGNLYYSNQVNEVINVGPCFEGDFLSSDNGTFICNKCQGCLLCEQKTSKIECYQCSRGQYNEDFKCLSCRPHCAQCDSYDFCKKCNDTFIVNGSQCQCQVGQFAKQNVCVACLKGCLECSNEKQCSRCDTGYFNKEGVCSLCEQNCLVCTSLNECSACRQGYDLIDKQCQKHEDEPKSSKTWIIILSVIIGILAVGVAALIIYKKVLKKRSNPLLDEQNSLPQLN